LVGAAEKLILILLVDALSDLSVLATSAKIVSFELESKH